MSAPNETARPNRLPPAMVETEIANQTRDRHEKQALPDFVHVIGSADFITLYDVGSTAPGGNFVSATAGAGFSASTQNLGINAAQTLPNDDALLTDVTFKYTGPTISADTVFPGFSIVVNSNNGTTLKQFTGQYTDNQGPELDTKIGEIGLVAVPAAGSIPEPGTVLMGMMMGVCGLLSRRAARR